MPGTQTLEEEARPAAAELPLEERLGFGERSPWPDLLVLGGSLAVLTWGLGKYGLYEPHEGHFAEVGREMLLSGDWLTPHLNGSPYLNKPPLLYWMVALSQWLCGVNEWAARLPVALSGWLGVLLAWSWGRRLWGPAVGRLAAGALALSAGWFVFTHQILIDVLLASLQFGALYCLWHATAQPRSARQWLGFYVLLALAVMAKGPVSIIFPAFAFLGFAVVRRRWALFAQAGLWWGIPLVLLPVTLWALLVEQRNPGFLEHALVNEHWNRLWDERWPRDYAVSQVSALGYLGITAVWCAPWILFLPQAARFAWRALRLAPGASGEQAQTSDAVLLLALAFLAPVLLFLPIPSRLVYYCLPAAPPLAVLVAGWWLAGDRRPEAGGRRPEERQRPGLLSAGPPATGPQPAVGAALVVLSVLAFCLPSVLAPTLRALPDLQRAPATLDVFEPVAWLLGTGLLLAGVFLVQRRPRAAAFWLCVFLAGMWMRVSDGLVDYQDIRSSRRLVAELNPRLGRDALWVSEGSYELGASGALAFYLGTDVRGRARTVRVMTDDERRPPPQFGELPRGYETDRQQLRALWDGPQPVAFVTDLMRRDWDAAEDAPRLPEGAGAPIAACGFRRAYANAAARERLARKP